MSRSFETYADLLGRVLIQWVTFFKYLGVTVVGGKALSFDIAPVKRASFELHCLNFDIRAQ